MYWIDSAQIPPTGFPNLTTAEKIIDRLLWQGHATTLSCSFTLSLVYLLLSFIIRFLIILSDDWYHSKQRTEVSI
jgi:hypothetical protein